VTAPQCVAGPSVSDASGEGFVKLRLKSWQVQSCGSTLLETGHHLFDAYNRFLGILADGASRKHLESLEEDQYESDRLYTEARVLSRVYSEALLELFFDQKSGLFNLTRNYGVF
jgi:hypothetical protein